MNLSNKAIEAAANRVLEWNVKDDGACTSRWISRKYCSFKIFQTTKKVKKEYEKDFIEYG